VRDESQYVVLTRKQFSELGTIALFGAHKLFSGSGSKSDRSPSSFLDLVCFLFVCGHCLWPFVLGLVGLVLALPILGLVCIIDDVSAVLKLPREDQVAVLVILGVITIVVAGPFVLWHLLHTHRARALGRWLADPETISRCVCAVATALWALA